MINRGTFGRLRSSPEWGRSGAPLWSSLPAPLDNHTGEWGR
jgi:hypothetical protein